MDTTYSPGAGWAVDRAVGQHAPEVGPQGPWRPSVARLPRATTRMTSTVDWLRQPGKDHAVCAGIQRGAEAGAGASGSGSRRLLRAASLAARWVGRGDWQRAERAPPALHSPHEADRAWARATAPQRTRTDWCALAASGSRRFA